jgi:hypothetical protein
MKKRKKNKKVKEWRSTLHCHSSPLHREVMKGGSILTNGVVGVAPPPAHICRTEGSTSTEDWSGEFQPHMPLCVMRCYVMSF